MEIDTGIVLAITCGVVIVVMFIIGTGVLTSSTPLPIITGEENRCDNIAPEKDEAAPLQHKNAIIQKAMMVIQAWLSSTGLDNLSVPAICYEQMTDKEFSTKVLMELFTKDRSKTLQTIIDYFGEDGRRSRKRFSMVLSSLVVIALDVPRAEHEFFIQSLSNLLCIAPDSLPYDVIIRSVAAEQLESNTLSLISRTSPIPNLKQNRFVSSKPASIHTSFVSKVPIVNRFPRFATVENEISPILGLLTSEILSSSGQILKLILRLSLRLKRFTRIGTDCSREIMGIYKETHMKPPDYYTKLVTTENMGAYNYFVDMLTMGSDIKKLLAKLDILESIQASRRLTIGDVARLEKVKNNCRSLINSYEEIYNYMNLHARAFIIEQLCDIQTVLLTKSLKAHLFGLLGTIKQRRRTSKAEISELQTLTQNRSLFVQSIQDRQRANLGSPDDQQKYGCEDRVNYILSNIKTWKVFSDQVVNVWLIPLSILDFVDRQLSDVDGKRSKKEIIDVASHQLKEEFDIYKLSQLHESASSYGEIGSLYKELAMCMIDYLHIKLADFKYCR